MYLIYPFLVAFRRRIGIDACLSVAVAISVATLGVGYLPTPLEQTIDATIWHSPLISWAAWVLGAWIVEKHESSLSPAITAGWLVVLGSLGALVGTEVYRPLVVVMGPVGMSAVLIDRYGRRPGQMNRLESCLAWLGLVIYSVYLLHQPLLGLIASRLPLSTTPFSSVHIGLFMPTLIIAVAMGWLWYLVFKQGGLWLRGKLRPTHRGVF